MDPTRDQYQFSKKRPASANLAGRTPQEVRTIQFGEADKIGATEQSSPSAAVQSGLLHKSLASSRSALRKGPCSLRSSFFGEQPTPQHNRLRDQQRETDNPILRKQREPLIKYHRNATSLTDGPFTQGTSSSSSPSGGKNLRTDSSPPRAVITVDKLLQAADEGGANLRAHIFRAAAFAVRRAGSPERTPPKKDVDSRRSNDDEDDDEADAYVNARYLPVRELGIPTVGIGLRALLSAFEKPKAAETPAAYVVPASFSQNTPVSAAKEPDAKQQSGLGMLAAVLEHDILDHVALQKKKRDHYLQTHHNNSSNSNGFRPSESHQQHLFQQRYQVRSAEKWSVVHEAFGMDAEDVVVGSAVRIGKSRRPMSASHVRPQKEESLLSTLRKTPLSRPTSATSRQSLPSSTSGEASRTAAFQRQAPRPSSAPLRRTFTSAVSAHEQAAQGAAPPQAPWLDERGLIGVSLDPSRASPGRENSPPPVEAHDEKFSSASTPPKRLAHGVFRGGAGFVMYSKSSSHQ